eukprot:GHRR01034145.1.p1 GENE.GHRR01034145.1~~GHRR01034145.1.p1  ORF type:complete len:152 (+),score=65.26 GHRR01034145.1:250-705(+)
MWHSAHLTAQRRLITRMCLLQQHVTAYNTIICMLLSVLYRGQRASRQRLGRPFPATGGLFAMEAIKLLQDFYIAGNPAAPKPHRPIMEVPPWQQQQQPQEKADEGQQQQLQRLLQEQRQQVGLPQPEQEQQEQQQQQGEAQVHGKQCTDGG